MTIATSGSAGPRMPSPRLAALVAASMVLVAVLFIDSNERKQTIRDERLYVTERLSATRARLEAAINIPVSTTRAIAVIYAAHADMPGHEFASLAAQAKAFSPSIIDIALFRDTTVSQSIRAKATRSSSGWIFASCPCSGRPTRT